MSAFVNPWGSAGSSTCQPVSREALCRSRTFWLRYDPGRKSWIDKTSFEPFLAPAETIACWLTEQGGRFELELRVGSSGQHAGVWLGLTALGATPRDAARLARHGNRAIMDSAIGFRWKVEPCAAPRLPRQHRFLQEGPAHRRLEKPEAEPYFLTALSRVARKGSPLVLCFRITLRHCTTDLFTQARQLRDLAMSTGSHDQAAHRAARIMDQAASLNVEACLHARRLPGEVPLRLLSGALTQDFEASLCWGNTPVLLEARPSVLRHFVNLLSASEMRPARHPLEDMPF
jgi:hypothetical protein